MHRLAGLAVLLALWQAAPSLAQQSMTSFVTGVNPGNIKYTQVDGTDAFRSPGTTNRWFRMPRPVNLFNIGRLFPRQHYPVGLPQVGKSNYPGMKMMKVKTTANPF